jgi:phage gp45-like
MNMAALRSIVTRGRVIASALNPKRTLIQLSGLAGEIMDQVELIMPYGMSALPKGSKQGQGDVILLQVQGSRAHLVAIGADDPTLRITDLEEGEFGFQDQNGQKVIFRKDRLEVITPLKLVMAVEGDMEQTVNGKLTQTVEGDVEQTVNGKTTLTCDEIHLGGAGGKAVVLDGDPVAGGTVHATSTKVKAQ